MSSCNTQRGACQSAPSRARVGALNSVFRAGNHPYYTGPCPPAPCVNLCGDCSSESAADCRCRDGFGPCPHAPCGQRPEATSDAGCGAVFSAGGAICLPAGGPVPLNACQGDRHAFACGQGGILIHRPGLYFAVVTMDVPCDCPVNTVLRLELDNQSLSPPELAVVTEHCGTAASFTGHTVFRAQAGSTLRLCTLEAVSLPDSGCPAFTLTLLRLN